MIDYSLSVNKFINYNIYFVTILLENLIASVVIYKISTAFFKFYFRHFPEIY